VDDSAPDDDDPWTSLDNEERCARLVGPALHKAFSDDSVFREELGPLVDFLNDKSWKCDATKDYYCGDTLNHYLVSAYHASRAVELLADAAREYASDPYQFGKLIIIHHTIGTPIIFQLDSARSLMTLNAVLQSLEVIEKKSIEDIFNEIFPRLKDARDALAHQDERSLVVHYDKQVSGRNPIAHQQIDGQLGADFFGLRDKNQENFRIHVGSGRIVELVGKLRSLFKIEVAGSKT
jgi:hypothetical protein